MTLFRSFLRVRDRRADADPYRFERARKLAELRRLLNEIAAPADSEPACLCGEIDAA